MEWLPLLPPSPRGDGGGWTFEMGRNLGIDSQNQRWKGLRGTFGLFSGLWAKFRIKHLILYQ